MSSYYRVFVGGPSAVGKTTLLNYIYERYEDARVSDMSFETLQDGKKTAKEIAEELATKRNEDLIYEHSPLCMKLYQLIFKYKKNLRKKSNDTIVDFWNECLNVSTTPIYDNIFIIIDTTEFLKKRFYNRSYNNIDWLDDMYLYLQTIAYVSLMRKRHLYQGCRFVVIYDPNETSPNCLFGIRDALNLKNIIDSYFVPGVDFKFPYELNKKRIAEEIMMHHTLSLRGRTNLVLFKS
ncbi:putative guanylate kinase [Gryllus bimaculatus nudivirus]|uniref:Putative guanylate kinase n=1 Tax=Gryllus bimaculatus nudivirus TaxID=432587 RepID=A4L237_9VIRU|nr:putative guanylate kinase [Gryllus bimaculatus nudivirus]ABO45407.1 putative guanylate kinase [Gryllus bimaculatus nudivirus]